MREREPSGPFLFLPGIGPVSPVRRDSTGHGGVRATAPIIPLRESRALRLLVWWKTMRPVTWKEIVLLISLPALAIVAGAIHVIPSEVVSSAITGSLVYIGARIRGVPGRKDSRS